MKAMEERALDILKDTKNSSIMNRMRSEHELTNQMNNICKIQTSDGEIDEITNQLSV
jgi:hypothetical protein